MDKTTKDNDGCSRCEETARMTCRTCDSGTPLPYWCDTCRRPVPDKRCPGCGLKARKIRHPAVLLVSGTVPDT